MQTTPHQPSSDERTAQWIIIVPLSGLNPVGGEGVCTIPMIRVTLVERKTLFRSKKYNLNKRHKAAIVGGSPSVNSFKAAKMFAVIRFTGKPREIRLDCIQAVEEELSIFSASRIGMKRKFWGPIGMAGQYSDGFRGQMFIDPNSETYSIRNERYSKGSPLLLGRFWKEHQRKSFFPKLLGILRGKGYAVPEWRRELRRAAVMIGRSYNCTDLIFAFLQQMIALEILLTKHGDKYTKDLPQRLEAFLGWSGMWHSGKFKERIAEVYEKRCGIVHAGKINGISIRDLRFADDMVFNILHNIVMHPRLFVSKDSVIDFCEKVAAEQLLGVRPRVRPKSLIFMERNLSDNENQGI